MTLITPQQAEDAILKRFPKAKTECVSLSEGFGRSLATPILADRPIPPFDRVMMDGIGIMLTESNSQNPSFEITGTQAAGTPPLELQNPGFCIEVMTGAVAPRGINCVVPVEAIDISETKGAKVATVTDKAMLKMGAFIHRAGSDSAKNATLLEPGIQLRAPELATAASCGYSQIQVHKIPKIYLLTSGDEVIPVEQSPAPHQIRASHPIAIQTCIESQRLGRVQHHHLPDDPKLIEDAIRNALAEADVLILTGGVSKGKFDFIAPLLRELCGPAAFHGVSQRPGKPFAYHCDPIPVFALPGNPLSVMACLARYVLPALKQHVGLQPPPQQLPLANDIMRGFPLTQLLASQIIDGKVHPSNPKNSGEYTAIHHCQGIIEIPAQLKADTPITTLPFYPW